MKTNIRRINEGTWCILTPVDGDIYARRERNEQMCHEYNRFLKNMPEEYFVQKEIRNWHKLTDDDVIWRKNGRQKEGYLADIKRRLFK